jgi:hypothetical protein
MEMTDVGPRGRAWPSLEGKPGGGISSAAVVLLSIGIVVLAVRVALHQRLPIRVRQEHA